MLRNPTASIVLTALLTLAAVPATAGELTLRLDPEVSAIEFRLRATLHTVKGSFRLEEGEIRLEASSGEISGRVVVDATSGESGNEKRDRDMHTKVLESREYPRFVFAVQRLEGELALPGSSRVTLHGTLEIHGRSHPLTTAAEVNVEGDRVEATATFEVPYVEWGMEDPSKFLLRVAKTVEVTVRAVGWFAER